MKIDNKFNIQIPEIKKQPSFGSAAGLSEKLLSGGALRKFSDAIEYKGFSMSSASLLGLFYFSVVFPRYLQAYDKYDRREILRRDLISLTALTFMAQALGRGFSEVCSKVSGFVLNKKPEDFNKFGKKIWNYIYPEAEFATLKNDEIIAHYSKIDGYKNGIVDFCEFIDKSGGNVKKVLSFHKGVKANVEKLLGKSIESSNYKEIVNAFKNNAGSKTLEEIYKVFRETNNPFVKRAKLMNTAFGFLSTFLLVPSLIVWIAKSNEKMTKKRIAAENAARQAKREEVTKNENTPTLNEIIKSAQNSSSADTKKTFAYFLGDK